MALRIYNASAGSGKTFTLVSEFLRLSLCNEPFVKNGYQSILAITFTKKAASEMKHRIISALHDIASGRMQGQGEKILSEKKLSEQELKQRARWVLEDVLFNYGRLNVSTIDSFFQKMLISFSKELNLSPKLQIELNTNVVSKNTVQQLLSKVNSEGFEDTTKQLLYLLKAELEKPNGEYKIEAPLLAMTNELFEDGYRAKKEISKDLTLELIKDVEEKYQKRFKKLNDQLAQLVRDFDLAYEQSGFSIDDFQSGRSNFYKKIVISAKNALKSSTFEVISLGVDIIKSLSKGKYGQNIPSGFGEKYLQPIIDWFENHTVEMSTWTILMKNWEITKLSETLENELELYRKESGIFPLADATLFLKEITLGDEASFIYEKMGAHINHIFIDEFQDTSRLQWQNLAPLVKNSLANGHDCLLVGDIKQSIYRWRGGDLNLLRYEVAQEINRTAEVINLVLKDNFRSSKTVINFNNFLYKPDFLPSIMDEACQDKTKRTSSIIADAYKDSQQNVKSTDIGFVQLEFHFKLDKKNKKDLIAEIQEDDEEKIEIGNGSYLAQRLPLLLDELIDKGYNLKDIGILVRKNNEADAISAMLKNPEYGDKYKLVTEKSLLVNDALIVNIVMSALKLIVNNLDTLSAIQLLYSLRDFEDKKGSISEAIKSAEASNPDYLKQAKTVIELLPKELSYYFRSISIKPLYELVESIIVDFGLHKTSSESTHLQTFRDKVLSFTQKNGSDLAGFIDWWTENESDISIAVPETENAIRLLTIHKSKGLEYPVVIIPMATWVTSVRSNLQPEVWVQAPDELELNHIQFKSKVADKWVHTGLAKEYAEELEFQHLDALNFLYVATTRAEKMLYMMMPNDGINKDGKISNSTIGKVLSSRIPQALNTNNLGFEHEIKNFTNGDVHLWRCGEEKYYELKKAKDKGLDTYELQQDLEVTKWREKLTIRPLSKSFFSEGLYQYALNNNTKTIDAKVYGNLIHSILANVQDETNLAKVIADKCLELQLDDHIVQAIQNQIAVFFGNEQFRSWFKRGLKVITEKDIMLPASQSSSKGRIIRPDRVIFTEGNITIIDFKTGKNHSTYKKQLKTYAEHLGTMYPDYCIDAYLAFINENPEIQKVDLAIEDYDMVLDQSMDKLL